MDFIHEKRRPMTEKEKKEFERRTNEIIDKGIYDFCIRNKEKFWYCEKTDELCYGQRVIRRNFIKGKIEENDM